MRCHFPRNPIPGAGLRRSVKSDAGFTLMEMVVSAAIVALIMAGVGQALIAGAHVNADQRIRSQANQLAQQDQERLKGMSSKQLFGLGQPQTWTITQDNTVFTGTSQATFLNAQGGSTCTPAGAGAAAYFSVVSTVNWGSNLRTPVKEESVITPPAGGALLTQVKDQNSLPLSGVNVSASGPDFEGATTDATGCAIFGGLPTGSYTVTLAATGYVDPTGNPSPSSTATVTSTGTSVPLTNPMTLGQAGSLNATLVATDGTGGEADALSWSGAGSILSMPNPKSVTSSGAVSTFTATNLFPFAFSGPSYTNNYQAWAGACPQMQPPATLDRFSVNPGQSQPASVQEPVLKVVVTNSGNPVVPNHVKITYQSAGSNPGPACPDSWQAKVQTNGTGTTNALANPGQPFVTGLISPSAGASASGYTGALSVCADYSNRKLTISGVTDSFTSATTVPIPITFSSPSANGTC